MGPLSCSGSPAVVHHVVPPLTGAVFTWEVRLGGQSVVLA